MVDMNNKLIDIQHEAKLQKEELERKVMMLQINLHFLYNTLEVISGIAEREGMDQLTMMIESLSKMLRYNADFNTEQVMIADEIENCRNYVQILENRFEDQLLFEWDIHDEVGQYWMIKMVLQPLVENSIKYGVEKKPGKEYIKLSLKRYEQYIEIQLQDNGIGFDLKKLQNFESFKQKPTISLHDVTVFGNLGLKNVYARLHIFFRDSLTFTIQSIPGEGTIITIQFPAISQPKTEKEA